MTDLPNQVHIYVSIHPSIHPRGMLPKLFYVIGSAEPSTFALSVSTNCEHANVKPVCYFFYLRVVSEDSDVLILVQRLLRSNILTRQCPEIKFCSQYVKIIASST
jgi:hypothetical protein